MSDVERLLEYLHRMQAAARQALGFVSDLDLERFQEDVRTQMAVTMALVLVGEAASRMSALFPDFTEEHTEVPWARIKGMRNLIAHDYYELEMALVWDTLQRELPNLIAQIEELRSRHVQGE